MHTIVNFGHPKLPRIAAIYRHLHHQRSTDAAKEPAVAPTDQHIYIQYTATGKEPRTSKRRGKATLWANQLKPGPLCIRGAWANSRCSPFESLPPHPTQNPGLYQLSVVRRRFFASSHLLPSLPLFLSSFPCTSRPGLFALNDFPCRLPACLPRAPTLHHPSSWPCRRRPDAKEFASLVYT